MHIQLYKMCNGICNSVLIHVVLNNSGISFYVHGSVHHKSILINVQQDATICNLYFIPVSLYMFQVPSTPFVRSS